MSAIVTITDKITEDEAILLQEVLTKYRAKKERDEKKRRVAIAVVRETLQWLESGQDDLETFITYNQNKYPMPMVAAEIVRTCASIQRAANNFADEAVSNG